jgi:short subunit fatty acids transporter
MLERSRMKAKIARFSNLFVNAADRSFPESYVFVLAVVALVSLAAILHGASPLTVSRAFGDGFWTLIPFTLQMTHVAIGGYIVATSPAAAKIMRWLARRPSNGRSAVVFVGVLSIFLSLLKYMALPGRSPRGCIRRQVPGLSPRTEGWPCRQRCNIPARSRR